MWKKRGTDWKWNGKVGGWRGKKEEAQWWQLEMNERWGHERRYEHTAKTHILPHSLQKFDAYLSHWLVWSQETDVSRIWRVDGMCSLWWNGWGRFQRGPEWGQKRPKILIRDLMFNVASRASSHLLNDRQKCQKSHFLLLKANKHTPRPHFVILTLNSGSLVPPWSPSCGSESWETFAECWLDRRFEVPGLAHPGKGPPDCPD